MDENRVTGTARNLGGKVEEGFGKTVGDTTREFKGKADQAVGAAQDLYGQAKDTAVEAVSAAKERASDVEDYVRKTIEERPYTVVAAALALGWVIGHVGHYRRDSW
jgi:uncharacterized protein YjbJ (UPF0337 family)